MGARYGRYETLSPIASGGMATVHLARAVGAGGFERLVAIKVMHPGLADDPDFSAMFLDEARLAARIRHPNVVGTVDVQDGPEGLFLVMEYVEGPSLAHINRALRKGGARMPVGVALRIVIDALQGLHAAHEQTGPSGEPLRIVHRDVSPQNVLVSVDGLAKITDFGVVRAESRISSTRRGEVKGKLAYMSPQQVRTEPIDRRADVYAAGVVLWELLAGERLFTGDNDAALILSVVAGPQRSPRAVNAGVPEAIDAACMHALRIVPEERFPTALAFADALEEAAEAAGVSIATPRALAKFVKELGAHKTIDIPPLAGEPASSPSTRHDGAASGPKPRAGVAGAASAPDIASPDVTTPKPAAPAEVESNVASVLTAAEPRRSPSRAIVWIGVAAVLGFGAVAIGAHFLAGSPPTPTATPATAPPPKETAASAAPSASATEVATAAPSATASAAPSASAAAKPAPTTKPAVTGKGPHHGSDWRPEGL